MVMISLIDLNNFRSAPKLKKSQIKKLSEELEMNIHNADWITIGIMAPSDYDAITALQSISKNYPIIKFKGLNTLHAHGNVFDAWVEPHQDSRELRLGEVEEEVSQLPNHECHHRLILRTEFLF